MAKKTKLELGKPLVITRDLIKELEKQNIGLTLYIPRQRIDVIKPR